MTAARVPLDPDETFRLATFVVGLGAPQWVLSAALGYVALASFITVVQRIVVVSRQMAGRAIAADGVEQETSV